MASVPFGKLACAIRLVSSGMGASGWACSDIFDPPSGLHASSYSFLSTLPSSASLVQLSIPNFPAESFIHPIPSFPLAIYPHYLYTVSDLNKFQKNNEYMQLKNAGRGLRMPWHNFH